MRQGARGSGESNETRDFERRNGKRKPRDRGFGISESESPILKSE